MIADPNKTRADLAQARAIVESAGMDATPAQLGRLATALSQLHSYHTDQAYEHTQVANYYARDLATINNRVQASHDPHYERDQAARRVAVKRFMRQYGIAFDPNSLNGSEPTQAGYRDMLATYRHAAHAVKQVGTFATLDMLDRACNAAYGLYAYQSMKAHDREALDSTRALHGAQALRWGNRYNAVNELRTVKAREIKPEDQRLDALATLIKRNR